MKKFIFFTGIIALIIGAILIRNNQFAESSKTAVKFGEEKTKKDKKTRKERKAKKPVENPYRLSISFESKGEGIDKERHQEFVKFIESLPEDVEFEKNPWGREGEVDYCFKLSDLKPKEQEQFISEAKKAVGRSKKVQVIENGACPH